MSTMSFAKDQDDQAESLEADGEGRLKHGIQTPGGLGNLLEATLLELTEPLDGVRRTAARRTGVGIPSDRVSESGDTDTDIRTPGSGGPENESRLKRGVQTPGGLEELLGTSILELMEPLPR